MFIALAFILLLALSTSALLGSMTSKVVSAYHPSQPSFGTPQNLSNDNASATNPNVANVGTHVYVAWSERDYGLKFRASSDAGLTWTPALDLAPPGRTTAPLISANGSNVYVIWSQTIRNTGSQILISTSTDYGASFSSPVQITSGSGGYITPVIASWGSLVAVAYDSNGASFVTTSQDNGTTWRAPLQISTNHEPQLAIWKNNVYAIADPVVLAVSNDAGKSWALHNVGYGSEGWLAAFGPNLYAAWETKGNSSQVYALVSNNYGINYTVNIISGALPNAWAPMVGAFGDSAWIAIHINPGSSLSQVYVYTTTNDGATWSSPVALSGKLGSGTDTSFPFTVATSDGANVFVAWAQQVSPGYWKMMASYSSDGGSTWTRPPGINASNNVNGTQASNNNDLADGAISSYGATCFAVWQLVNGTSNQVYFASDNSGSVSSTATTTSSSSPSTSTNTSTSDSSGVTTTSSSSSSYVSTQSSSIQTSSSSSSTTSSGASSSTSTTSVNDTTVTSSQVVDSSSSSNAPWLMWLALGMVAVFVSSSIAMALFFARRKRQL